ncbi:DUF6243 family protein [Streptomyces sp. NPDC005931]|uniref:DUF6243 family protein n=1 Tax=Streptomyces sp. NPDC005931 TaxID=3364737 RepID=UPI0036A13233
MTRGGAGNMLGVGGTRQHLGREALRGGERGGRVGGGRDPQAQKRELLRKLQQKRQEDQGQEDQGQEGQKTGGPEAVGDQKR